MNYFNEISYEFTTFSHETIIHLAFTIIPMFLNFPLSLTIETVFITKFVETPQIAPATRAHFIFLLSVI